MLLIAASVMAVNSPGSALAQGIYTCVDGKGRRITSDRPNIECIDRTQQEMSTAGTVKRVLGPSLTAQERAALEEKDRLAAQERARDGEERRRDRALLLRYPSRAVHDNERRLALVQVDEVTSTAHKRMLELALQRKPVNQELEFYQKDVSRAPPALRRTIEESDSNMLAQKQFIADQDLEKQRVNTRFDEELVRLKQLWTLAGVPSTATPEAGNPASAGRNAVRK